MKRPVMRDLYAVAVAFLGPHCVKWWRRYLAQGIAGLESHSRRPKRSPSTKTGTCEQVQHVLNDNPFSGHLFIFRGRRGDTVKILWADADGLCLFTKRLEEGQFIWPAVRDGKISITRSQLAML